MCNKWITSVSVAAVVVCAVGSFAFADPWENDTDSGSNARCEWYSGEHMFANKVHGSPTVIEDGFHFLNEWGDMDFSAAMGESIQAGVQVTVDTVAAGTDPIEFVTVREWGTWGGVLADVGVQPSFSIFDWTNYQDTGELELPDPVIESDGTWHVETTLVFEPGNGLGWPFNDPQAVLQITVKNLLSASGTDPSTFVGKTGLEIVIPEPSSLWLLLGFGPLLIRRARRR